MRILSYLSKTRNLGVTYSGDSPGTAKMTALHAPYESGSNTDQAEQGLHAACDSNWEVGKSISGYAFMLACGVIHWCSKGQPVTALSSTEAEIYAASSAVADAIISARADAFFGALQGFINARADAIISARTYALSARALIDALSARPKALSTRAPMPL